MSDTASAARRGRRAVVVGAGPNGLTAAAFLARAGWQVDVFERADAPGGAAASAPLLGDGTIVDLGAAGHPFGVASPAFAELALERHGIEWRHGDAAMAHPLEGRPAALLRRGLDATAAGLGRDARTWRALHGDLVARIDDHLENLLGPVLKLPPHPLALARFAPVAAPPAALLARTLRTDEARALLLGSAAHAIAPLGSPFTGAFGTLFGALGMTRGWPVARGGTGAIMNALVSVLAAHGGRLHLGREVRDLRELPAADATVLGLTPRQIVRLAAASGRELPAPVARRLERWRYGAAAYKVDYLLDGPVPWTDPAVAGATTVHVVGSPAELLRAEAEVAARRLPQRPFVMICQQQAADASRAPAGRTVIWAYAHVPHGYRDAHPGEVRGLMEAQIERFAPGFRDRVLEARVMTPAQLEAWNPNLVGGDIAGGAMTRMQSLLRPGLTADPYRLGPGLYLASSSAPPGAGVHGMPGAHAARAVLADHAPPGRGSAE
ncbi:MAG: NAD(P)/FAD-dependent oxidoreductase [Microbacteriaceae bacterium]|nr:NAD(P)/FAD-dependent oxidoreductase [Microbacteriaceae bacterium]